MSKKKKVPVRPVPNTGLDSFIEKGVDPLDEDTKKALKADLPATEKKAFYNKPYAEKKTKGRSISMNDAFYQSVKDFSAKHPELGGVSRLTIRALHEFMDGYKNK